MLRQFTAALVLASCFLSCFASAAEEAAPKAEKTPEQFAAELDSESYATRQAASEALAKLGKAGLPALEQAAASESAEASTRAFEILRNHTQGNDAELQAATKETLHKIAESGNANAARRAQEVLKPKTPEVTPADPNVIPGRIRLGGIGGEGIRIRVEAIAKGARRISVKNVNGVKDIEAEEEGRTVKIHDDPEEGIKMEVTEKKDGKEEKKEYKAKDAAELKEKHPEAHRIYEQYSQAGGVIKLDGIRLERAIAPALPLRPALPRVLERPAGAPDPKEISDRLEKAEQELKAARARLLERIKEVENVEEIERALKSLEETEQRLKEAAEKAKQP